MPERELTRQYHDLQNQQNYIQGTSLHASLISISVSFAGLNETDFARYARDSTATVVEGLRDHETRKSSSNVASKPQSNEQPRGNDRIEADPGRGIPPLLTKFLAYGDDQYDSIASFCDNTPAIWEEDADTLQPIIHHYLRKEDFSRARRVAQRLLMLSFKWRKSATSTDQLNWLRSLSRSRELREQLDRSAGTVLENMQAQASQTSTQQQTRHERRDNAALPIRRPAASIRAPSHSSENVEIDSGMTLLGSIPEGRQPPNRPRGSFVPSKDNDDSYEIASMASSSGRTRNRSLSQLSDIDSVAGGRKPLGQQSPVTQFMGPSTIVDGNWPKEVRNPLRLTYKVPYGRDELERTFAKGSLFAVFWHENHGRNPQKGGVLNEPPPLKPNRKGYVTYVANGETVYSHIRRFLVVRARKGFCVALPITSYSNRGVSAKNIDNREHNSHCIIHDSTLSPVLMPNEAPFTKDSVAVNMIKGETLSESSRLCYSKPYTIDHNIKVRYIGHVVDEHVNQVLRDYRSEHFDDD